MFNVHLLVSSTFPWRNANHAVKVAEKYSINLVVSADIDEVKSSSIPYVLTRGIAKRDVYSLDNKIWINDLISTLVVDDKYRTKVMLSRHKLDNVLLKTYFTIDEVDKFPVIVKPTNSSKGEGVCLCKTKGELINCVRDFVSNEVSYMIEEYFKPLCEDGFSEDYRAYFLGDSLAILIKRRNKGVTSNVSTGGKIEIISENVLSCSMLMTLKQVVKASGLNVSAIDFVLTGREDAPIKVFEVNSSPGVKALYENDIDAYDAFFKWYSGHLYTLEGTKDV